MADTQIEYAAFTAGFRFYDQYSMPFSTHSLGWPGRLSRVRAGDWALILVLNGTLAKPARLAGLRSPFITCLKKGEAVEPTDSACGETGFMSVFKPEIVNQDFLRYLPPTAEGIEDPFMRRDVDLVRPFVEDSGFYREIKADEAEFLSAVLKRTQALISHQDDPYWPCRSRSYFLEVLVFLNEARAVGHDSAEIGRMARRAMEYLYAHYPEKLSVEKVSDALGTNRTSLQKLFRAEYGISLMEGLASYRICMARLLMRNTSLSLKEIASRVGFKDYSRFFREFTSREGKSPLDFRTGKAKVRIY
jgi:AraC family L-rhamnose operon regulatory protein RhaS